MSLSTTKDTYNKAFRLYDKLNDAWYELESGKGTNIEFEVDQLLRNLNTFGKLIEKIYIDDLKGNISQEQLEHVKHNKDLFWQGFFMMSRHAKGIKYADEIKAPLASYIYKLKVQPNEYRQFADDEQDLVKKFVAALTHPDNVMDLELKLKRIAKGTMSEKEFRSIYDTYKGYIIRASDKKGEFQSFNDYRSGERVESEASWRERTNTTIQKRKDAGDSEIKPEEKYKFSYGFKQKE